MRITSASRSVKQTGSRRPRTEWPTIISLRSSAECSTSSKMRAKGSAKAVVASSKVTSCFLRFAAAFALSHSNSIRPFAFESHGRRLALDGAVERVALDRFEAGVFDERDYLLLRHLDLAAGLDRVALGQLAAFGDGAVEVVRAVVERDLRETLPQHDPVGLYVREVVEHQPRDGHRLQTDRKSVV